jgi:hypothetical protein
MEIKREGSFTFNPVIGIGFNMQKFKKPEYSCNLTIYKITLPFLLLTIGFREVQEVKLSRLQRRLLEKRVGSKIASKYENK